MVGVEAARSADLGDIDVPAGVLQQVSEGLAKMGR